jgi:hypothetical protein
MEKKSMSEGSNRMIYSRIILSLFFSLFTGVLYAQFSANEFLNQARNDVRLYEYEQKSKFLEKNPYKSPWIQRTEFRVRTNDLNISADDYRFRINPTNPFEIRENKKYYQMEFDLLFSDYQKSLNSALIERYQLLLDYLEYDDRILQKNTQIGLFQDELRILDAQADDPGFSLIDYLEARESLIQARLESNQLEHQKNLVQMEIRTKYSFEGDIAADQVILVDLQTIRNWIGTIFNEFDTVDNILIKNLHQKNLLTEQRIKLEKAEDRRNIGFLQAEYDRERGNELNDHMGFQIGVRIPLTNPDRPDMNRSKIDLLEDQADLMEKKAEVSLQGELSRLKLDYLFNQYDLIASEMDNNDFVKILSRSPDLKPDDLIKARRAILRLKRLEHEIKWEIYNAYIEYLYFSGRLIEPPLRNYLSANLEEL